MRASNEKSLSASCRSDSPLLPGEASSQVAEGTSTRRMREIVEIDSTLAIMVPSF